MKAKKFTHLSGVASVFKLLGPPQVLFYPSDFRLEILRDLLCHPVPFPSGRFKYRQSYLEKVEKDVFQIFYITSKTNIRFLVV